jgi:antitoxin VapB
MLARKVSLFRNGRSQALRIPKEFELPGREATIRREGDVLIIEQIQKQKSLLAYLKTLEPTDEDIGEIEDLPPVDIEI